MNRRLALLNRASPALMRAAGHAASQGAAQAVINKLIAKRTYDLAGKVAPTERPQTSHLELPAVPRGRGRLVLTPNQVEVFAKAGVPLRAGEYIPATMGMPS